MQTKLVLKNYDEFEGLSFGANRSVAGEVVFGTGMVGYPEAFTDPSFAGQILVMTYPLVGNYGVPRESTWESKQIWIEGLIVSSYVDSASHHSQEKTLAAWLKEQNVPALEIADTRQLTQLIRQDGVLLGKIEIEESIDFHDPNSRNLVAEVSCREVTTEGSGKNKIVLIDCGAKQNIGRELLKRDVTLTTVPWDYDVFANNIEMDGLVISNGPGDPKMAEATIAIVRQALEREIPILGICLGNQILTLAAGGDTYKLKYGHRSQNQPALMTGTNRCYLTTQNHGYAVGKVPPGFKTWFSNANDQTNEGIIHESKPFMSVQFHPEARPGPTDTNFIFDIFIDKLQDTRH